MARSGEVTAGGGFAALATGGIVTVAELSENRRQDHQWERAALAELRDGHVARAVAAYRSNDRVTVAPDRLAMLAAAVDRWSAATVDGLNPVLLAGTNSTVRALNLAARQLLIDDGRLGEALGRWSGRELAIGDRVVLRANDYRARSVDGRPTPLLNGHTATVLGATEVGLTVRLDHSGTHVVLSTAYLAASGVDYAYALTSHRAQGGTWDLAIAVGADGLYREAGYLALSRGRAENWLVLTQADVDAIDVDLVRHDRGLLLPGEEPSDVDDELIRRLSSSRGKQFALTIDPLADRVAEAAALSDVPTLTTLADRASDAEQRALAIVGKTPASALAAIERATATASAVAIGQSVKPTDRHNIGIVLGVDYIEGTVEVVFSSSTGRTAERRFRWDETSVVGERNPQPRPMSSSATAALDRIVGEHRTSIERWNAELAQHGVGPDDAETYRRASDLSMDRAAASLSAGRPAWLIDALGDRPTTAIAAQVWDDAVRNVASFRASHGVTDDNSPIGSRVEHHCGDWEAAASSLAASATWLTEHVPATVVPLRQRTVAELDDRRIELDATLATTPADQRPVIAALAGGQLSLTDAAEMLREALAGQDERRRWILEHWPHIVETTEVDAAMSAVVPAPETEPVPVGFDFGLD